MISPFTNPVIQLLQSFLPLPTILYWGTALVVLVTGLVLYLTSTDFEMADILSLLPRTIVSIQERIDKRKIGAIILILLGLTGTITFSDRLIAESQVTPGGGGPSLPALICTNSTIVSTACGPNLCTAANIGTSSCNLPANGCDGVYRVGIGRCETNATPVTVTIAIGQTIGTTTITFGTAFTNVPFPEISLTTIPTIIISNLITQVPFLTTQNFPWAIPGALTEFPGNQSDELPFNPSPYTQVQLSTTFSFATQPVAGSIMYLQISGNGGTSWTTLVSYPVDGTGTGCQPGIVNGGSIIDCSDFVSMPTLPPLSIDSYLLRVAGSGGDGTTKIQWSQIQASFSVPLPIPVFYGPQSMSKTSFVIKITIQSKLTTSFSLNFRWQAWSYTG